MSSEGECRRELISIIIPAYNAQTYIRRALESVSAQLYKHFEVVVVNDGSTDLTTAIVDEYLKSDGRIRVIHKENGGLADARNCGVDNAVGEWITFLDSDDCLYPDALSLLLSVAEKSRCEIVIGEIARRLNLHDNSVDDGFEVMPAGKAVAMTLYQKKGMEPSVCGKLFRRTIFDRERFSTGSWYEDLDFFYRAFLSVENIAVASTPVYYYRRNPTGFLHRFIPGRLDVLDVTERMERYIAINAPQLLPAAKDRRMSANFNMLGLLSLLPASDANSGKANECMSVIRSYRRASLFDPEVRIKNKLGALASYGGQSILEMLLRREYGEQRRVVTFGEDDFTDACKVLGEMVANSDFKPDMVVGIRSGGTYLGQEIAKMFPQAKFVEAGYETGKLGVKQSFGKILKFLPQWLLDRMRIMESKLLCMRVPKKVRGVKLPAELMVADIGNILIVDDAVDSGVTLSGVFAAINHRHPSAAIRSAVITITTKTPVMMPDYYLYNNMTLIRFPWSMDSKK